MSAKVSKASKRDLQVLLLSIISAFSQSSSLGVSSSLTSKVTLRSLSAYFIIHLDPEKLYQLTFILLISHELQYLNLIFFCIILQMIFLLAHTYNYIILGPLKLKLRFIRSQIHQCFIDISILRVACFTCFYRNFICFVHFFGPPPCTIPH